ncbi:transferase [Leptospirillum sp. Group II 'CF-1']|jgi:carbonic anhydrase/acetyltransferase-like protein (isoleucine patch superfamily)|nr:transferase [Leptospirillum sp. Group II 'CF-1']
MKPCSLKGDNVILSYKGLLPKIDPSVWIADSAQVIGDVVIGPESSVWFSAVIRGDVHRIRIGARTNIQDLCVLHVTRKTFPLSIGDDVTVGHRVILHGCTLGNRILVGMGSIVMDGAVIGDDVIIGAGSLVTENTVVEPGSLILGSPARIRRKLTEDEKRWLLRSATNYVSDRLDYASPEDSSGNQP